MFVQKKNSHTYEKVCCHLGRRYFLRFLRQRTIEQTDVQVSRKKRNNDYTIRPKPLRTLSTGTSQPRKPGNASIFERGKLTGAGPA